MKLFCLLTLTLTAAYAQVTIGSPEYRLEKVGAAPSGLPPSVLALLAKDGHRILTAAGKPVLEIWLRADALKAAPSTEDAVSFNTIPQGALLALVNVPEKWADRRGQSLKAGTYTLRYSLFPVTGDHQGVAPQRDFLLITPAKDDPQADAAPNFRELVAWSQKATGTPHPGVISIWKPEAADAKPGLSKDGDHDWVLTAKIGDLPISMILIGSADH